MGGTDHDLRVYRSRGGGSVLNKLIVSFSGGLTSAYMTGLLIQKYADIYETRIVFANTGQENEETLIFVDKCSAFWGVEVIWVEAVVHDSRKSSGHRIVNFSTASRNGEPFEQVIRKYGIPNKPSPHCTRELKRNAINSYRRSIGWHKCLMAIGIRADEPNRVSPTAAKDGIIYPLVHMEPTIKAQVNDYWEQQPFSLGLKGYQGNCKWCWRKSFSKLITIAKENPEHFNFPARMEREYATSGPRALPQVFFREHRSTQDILKMAQILQPSLAFVDPDENDGCSESCEAY